MQKLVTVREIYKQREKYIDQKIAIGGWIRSIRASNKFGFMVVHDGTYFNTLQVVLSGEMKDYIKKNRIRAVRNPYLKARVKAKAFSY